MLDILLSIAPIFVLIVLGHLFRRGGIPSTEFWNLNDKLVYWALFPCLLFFKTSTVGLSGELLTDIALVVYGGFAAVVLFTLVASKLLRLDGPLATSVLQGAARHNTFIALAVVARLFGNEALSVAALVTALLIPLTNVTVVTSIVLMLRGVGSSGVGRAMARDLMRNPLLIAVGLGIGVNVAGVGHIPVVHDVTEILGSAALPIVLLGIGANIRVRAMVTAALPTVLSIAAKMLLFPAVIFLLARIVGLPDTETLVVVIFGAVPSAASGYTLARQMGGDAPRMAAIITLQTLVSFVTLPLTVALVQQLLTSQVN